MVIILLIAGGIAGCVGQTSETPNEFIPPQTSFLIVGDPGTPFNAIVSDVAQSWQLTGAVPLTIVITNNNPPVRMVASKLVGGSALLSIQILNSGILVQQVASTTDPFGTVSVQQGGTLLQLSSPANPDVRFFVKAPFSELFNGLVEDQNNAHVISSSVPSLFLFEAPQGKVDGQFTQINNLGSFDVDLIINGTVTATGTGGPTVIVKGP